MNYIKDNSIYHYGIGIVCVILILLCRVNAQKNDVVVFYDGDRITGELKGLDYGKLKFKTDKMGTIYIKWYKIAQLEAKAFFEVESDMGNIFYGSLTTDTLGLKLFITGGADTIVAEKSRIVRITPIKHRVWARIDGSASLGFTYTKASDLLQFSLDGDAVYNIQKTTVSLSFSSLLTAQKDKDNTSRNNLSLKYLRSLQKRSSFLVTISSEQNSELGIDLRLGGGAAMARNLIHSNVNLFYAYGGLLANREWVRGSTTDNYNLELPVGLVFSKFRYDAPEIDLNTDLTTFTNLTTSGRFRIEFDSRLTWKFIKDFTLNFNLYASYDTKPPSTNAAKSDYGTTIGLGYSF